MEHIKKRARIIKASKLLQAKVGTGVISDEKIEEMAQIMEENQADFPSIAAELLEKISLDLSNARKSGNDGAEFVPVLASSVMQVKSNAGMFGAPLVSSISVILLDFLEEIKTMDEAVYDLMKTYDNIVRILINSKNIDKDSSQGQMLQTELKDACLRYFKKAGITPTSPIFR